MAHRVPLTLRDVFFADPFFESTWDDFEALRREMLRESNDFWNMAEREMNHMSRPHLQNHQNDKIEHESKNSKGKKLGSRTESDSEFNLLPIKFISAGSNEVAEYNPTFFPRRWMLPRLFGTEDLLDNKMKSLDIFQDADRQLVRLKNDDNKFEISLDTHGFKPDELKVNIDGKVLSIDAKHEEKGDNKFVSRQFSRKYTLPDDCEVQNVTSNLSSDGILMVTAPKKAALKDNSTKAIPVTYNK